MTELLARGAQVLVALSGAYLVALWFVLIVWTYRDIESRSRNVVTQVLSTTLSVLFFVPGVLLYMILRPKDTLDQAFQRSLEEEYLLQDLEELPLCPSCHHAVEDDYRLCPHCHARLREPCLACHRLVDLCWRICPYCAAPQRDAADASAADGVEALPGRWVAPGVARRRRVIPMPAPSLPAPGEVAAMVAETVQSPAPLQLPASLRSFARPFERWRHSDSSGDVVSSNPPVPSTSRNGVSADAGERPMAEVALAARGRFRPVAVIPRSLGETTPGGDAEGDANGSLNGNGRAGVSQAADRGLENQSDGNGRPSVVDEVAEEARPELVKTSSD